MLIAVILCMEILVALSALVTGGFFAFATIVLRGLTDLSAADGTKALNAINSAAAKPLKLLIAATAFLCPALTIALIWSWDRRWTSEAELGAILGIAGGVVYLLGAVLVTLERNAPLTKFLGTATDASGAMVWRIYRRDWAKWNYVRTAACAVACTLLVMAFVLDTVRAAKSPIGCPDIICIPCPNAK